MTQPRHSLRGAVDRLSFDRFAVAVFFITVGFTACLMPAQSDTWWQLRAGQDILTARAIPLHDTYSHTVAGGYWPDHEWLSQVIFYGLYRIGGLPLLTGAVAAIVTLTWILVWRLTPGRPMIRLGLCALALAPVATEWSLRPQVFTLGFLACTALLVRRRRFLWLPPLFLLWANLHGGVMLGLVVVAASVATLVVAERRILIVPILAALLCAVMTVVTPLGWSIWTEIPGSLGRLHAYGVGEWRPPDLRDPALLPFWLLVALFAALLVMRKSWRMPVVADVLRWSSFALFPVAMSASRNVAALAVVLVPSVGRLIEVNVPQAPQSKPSRTSHAQRCRAVCGGGVGGAGRRIRVGCGNREARLAAGSP